MSVSKIQKASSTASIKLCIKDVKAKRRGKPYLPTKSVWRRKFRKELDRL